MSKKTQALRVIERVSAVADLQPALVDISVPQPPEGHAVVEVSAAGINPSDVKAAMGMMPYAIWPRTPGRDYAGKVIAGPAEWIGQEVWGTGGDLGITRDGTHARYLLLPVAALVRRPAHIAAASAAMAGVPFVTAYEGLRRAGLAGAGQTVVVFGSNGKVGQAAIQLASRAGARVIGVERGGEGYVGHAVSGVSVIDGSRDGIARRVMELTRQAGADIAYNTVGSPYFAAALESLKVGGRQIVISTPDRNVPFDIQAFYRRDLQLIGVDSLKLDSARCAAVFRELLPGFEDGSLQSFPVSPGAVVPLAQAREAYIKVLEGAQDRPVLAP